MRITIKNTGKGYMVNGMKYYAAIDIGASSGRHILAHIQDGKIIYEEIHRFKNGIINNNGSLCWEPEYLFGEILSGLKKCHALGKTPHSLAIDTWGVDFVLLDKDDKMLGNAVSYRDKRTTGVRAEVCSRIPEAELYKKTGIQNQQFNTIFQLYALKKNEPSLLEAARSFLMMPDYFNFLLTGIKTNEYTNATTTGLVGALSKEWERDILGVLGIDAEIFQSIKPPGTRIGGLRKEVENALGFNTEVISAPSHDTASAVLAAPYAETGIYISSGTWSLIGVQNDLPLLDENSRMHNFTNEGGYDYKFRYLKNIMGFWMLQSIQKELKARGEGYSFNELSALAEQNSDVPFFLNVTDSCFLSPNSMIEAVQDYCRGNNQPVPQTAGEVSALVYQSLAHYYADTAKNIESLTGKTYDTINIIGGGSKDDYMNRLTAAVTGKTVIAGPVEAASLGNIIAQIITAGEAENPDRARLMLRDLY